MFTGIVKAVTAVKNAERRDASLLLYVTTPPGWKVKPGDSIATNGACLTVEKVSNGYYQCRLMPETLLKTTFGTQVPAEVNVEPALKLGGTLDGHLVTGHVDAVGKITKAIESEDSRLLTVQFPKEFHGLVAPKVSVALDGVSLTVVDAGRDWLTVSLVAYTLKQTTLGVKHVSDLVNIEFDILAKYVQASTRG